MYRLVQPHIIPPVLYLLMSVMAHFELWRHQTRLRMVLGVDDSGEHDDNVLVETREIMTHEL
jgi:hypothetical protein